MFRASPIVTLSVGLAPPSFCFLSITTPFYTLFEYSLSLPTTNRRCLHYLGMRQTLPMRLGYASDGRKPIYIIRCLAAFYKSISPYFNHFRLLLSRPCHLSLQSIATTLSQSAFRSPASPVVVLVPSPCGPIPTFCFRCHIQSSTTFVALLPCWSVGARCCKDMAESNGI